MGNNELLFWPMDRQEERGGVYGPVQGEGGRLRPWNLSSLQRCAVPLSLFTISFTYSLSPFPSLIHFPFSIVVKLGHSLSRIQLSLQRLVLHTFIALHIHGALVLSPSHHSTVIQYIPIFFLQSLTCILSPSTTLTAYSTLMKMHLPNILLSLLCLVALTSLTNALPLLYHPKASPVPVSRLTAYSTKISKSPPSCSSTSSCLNALTLHVAETKILCQAYAVNGNLPKKVNWLGPCLDGNESGSMIERLNNVCSRLPGIEEQNKTNELASDPELR
jgi:hypothetical protein